MRFATSACPSVGTHRLHTFLVEDSLVIRDNLIGLLNDTVPVEMLGVAEDQDSAVVWLQHHAQQCDLVILDIVLKTGSGLGVLVACRDRIGTAKWIVLSNHATPEMRRKCLEFGADAVFDKSNEIEAMLLYCRGLAGMDLIADASIAGA